MTTPQVEGADVVGEPVTYWAIYDDGSTGVITVTSQGEADEPVLSKPGRLVTQEEYDERLAEIREQQAANAQALAEADAARTREDYLELLRAGVAEPTARRMSGYEGPVLDPSGEEIG
jgi:hypothetical protein